MTPLPKLPSVLSRARRAVSRTRTLTTRTNQSAVLSHSRSEPRHRNFSETAEQTASSDTGGLAHRLRITAEVTVSKLFPAGFCWQFGGGVAESMGWSAETAGFAFTTGIFDAAGVTLGHILFYTVAKNIYLPELDLNEVRQTGLLLGSAALCSGTAWQPLQNLTTEGFTFVPAAMLVGGGCTLAFWGGLRIFRTLYSKLGMTKVAAPDSSNLGKDFQLSVAIGGAGACFVGTDPASYITATGVDTNWMRPIVGVEDVDGMLTGMTKAGTSTALGFAVVQMVQNVAWPKGKNWTD